MTSGPCYHSNCYFSTPPRDGEDEENDVSAPSVRSAHCLVQVRSLGSLVLTGTSTSLIIMNI